MPKDEDFYAEREYLGDKAAPITTLDKPLIIQVAPTGSFLRRDVNPNQPYTPEEVAAEVRDGCKAGASMTHLHVRDEDGIPDSRPEAIARTVRSFRDECDPVVTTNVRSNPGGPTYGTDLLEDTIGRFLDEQGSGYVDEITTTPRGVAHEPDSPYVMNERVLQEWVEYLQDRGLKPELQAYSFHEFANVKNWVVDQGILEKPYHVNVTTGQHAFFTAGPTQPHPAGVRYLATIKESQPLPEEDMVFGAMIGGRNWLPLTVEAILLGFDAVRVGMEDTALLYPHRDERIEGCGEVVEKIATICRELGREVATPDQARDLLGL